MILKKDSLTITPAADIIFYSFSQSGVLFRKGTRKLLVLNQTAAVIWCLLEESASLVALATSLVQRYGIDQKTAEQDIENTLAFFAQEGLFVDNPPAPMDELIPWPELNTLGPDLAEPPAWACRKRFRTHSHLLEICCQHPEIIESFCELMGHLRADGQENPNTRIWVLEGGAKVWDIFLDGRILEKDVAMESVLPFLFMINFIRSCDAMRDQLLFHAAVIAAHGTAALFPGITTSGKTTLAAALVQRGYTYFSDELAVIDPVDQLVSPYPLPMSIKPGAVPVLESIYPGLSQKKVYLRADHKKVRYIMPLEVVAAEGDKAGIGCIIFPQFIAETSTELRELPKAEALNLLARTGSSNRELTVRDVEVMIDLVEQTSCYALSYANLDDAVAAVDKILIKLNR